MPANSCSRRGLLAASLAWPLAPAAAAAPLTVGPGKRFSRVADALAEAHDGDTVLVDEGEYRGDVGVIARKGLVLRGLGRGAVFHADGRHAEGKAIWVVRGEAVLENLTLTGCRVPHGNGAGIRFEQGRLTLRRCSLLDNEMGLLSAGGDDSMKLEVEDCDFGQAPLHPGPLRHLLYVGGIGQLVLRGSRLGGGWRGHLVKSRARRNDVRGNWLVDGATGQAAYELEFPNGSHNVVVGNVIAQGEGTRNATLVSMGAEAGPADEGSLLMVHNTLVDGGAAESRFVHVWGDRLPAGLPVTLANNLWVGKGRLEVPAGAELRGNHRLDIAALRDPAQGDFRPRPGLEARPERVPAAALPLVEFTWPRGSRPVNGAVSAGAVQSAP